MSSSRDARSSSIPFVLGLGLWMCGLFLVAGLLTFAGTSARHRDRTALRTGLGVSAPEAGARPLDELPTDISPADIPPAEFPPADFPPADFPPAGTSHLDTPRISEPFTGDHASGDGSDGSILLGEAFADPVDPYRLPPGPLARQFPDATGVVGRACARFCLDGLGWGGAWLFPMLLFVWGNNRLLRRRWLEGLVPSILAVVLAVAAASFLSIFWHHAGGGGGGTWVYGGARGLLGPLGSLLFLLALVVLSIGFVAERQMMALGRMIWSGTKDAGAGAAKAGEWMAGQAREATVAAGGVAAGAVRDAASRFRPTGELEVEPAKPAKGPRARVAAEEAEAARPARRRSGADADATTGPEGAEAPAEPPKPPRIVRNAALVAAEERLVTGQTAGERAVEAARAAAQQMPIGLKAPKEPLGLPAGPEPEGPIITPGHDDEIDLPNPDLLDIPKNIAPPVSEEELLESSRVLMQTLSDFGILGRVGEVHPGPVITRFEYEPAAGVKIATILNRADDLALALKATRIRIVAPIPGKAAVGIEIPNRNPATVYLREIVDRSEFLNLSKGLSIALGKDINGKPYYADLTKMPHLLIAGTTGSGKSVCVNSIITSLVLRKSPRELRLLMIDPKMLELPVYNGIPHLIQPVVTDPKLAARCLRGLITEMERRYGILARRGVRNIDLYHERLDEDEKDGLEVIGERLPYVVAIIDELADLMITTSCEVEEPIGRLAQTARAVGIHLIVATQRPSVDVLTGVIKANFPSRIAFQVASRTDSRTILDMNGADSLLGRGDMLFLPSGRPEPDRVHGAFVSDRDTERVVKFWKRVKPELPSIDLEPPPENDGPGGMGGDDALFEEAARLVVLHQQGSASLLQRRLKVGYSRAARLVDMLEEAGIVAPSEGSKAREVLVNDPQLDEILKFRSGAPA